MLNRIYPFAVLLMLYSFSFPFQVKAQPALAFAIKAAVIKIDITPDNSQTLLGYAPRKSTGINDRIYHRIIVLDDGTTQFYLVASDICIVSPSEYDHVAALLNKQFGINPLNFWWSFTHTHSAPEVGVAGLPGVLASSISSRYTNPHDTDYANFVKQKLIAGISEARRHLVPVRVGAGWGFSNANINRRTWDIDGKACGGMNPDGPVDRKIGLIRFDKEDGTPLALIANYAMHGTVLGPESTVISADAPGIVSEYVESKIGAPMLYINGAAGNLAPIYSVYPNPKTGNLNNFRMMLGDKIIEANKKINATLDSVRLVAGSLTVETPRKKDLGWPDDLANYTRTASDGSHLVKLPVRFLKINKELALWSAPLELFCEIAMNVREQSPFKYTFYCGYTNGWLGYLATEEEWPHGGYEVETVSPYTVSVEKDFTVPVVSYLNKEMVLDQKTLKSSSKKKRSR